MRRRSNLRRRIKWSAVALSALILLVWLYSFTPPFFSVSQRLAFAAMGVLASTDEVHVCQSSESQFEVALVGGSLHVSWFPRPIDYPRSLGTPTFSRWRPGFSRQEAWCLALVPDSDFHVIHLPLWIPVAAMLGLTAVLVLRDRPIRCQHGAYSIISNVSGVCPECGTSVPSPASSGRGERT